MGRKLTSWMSGANIWPQTPKELAGGCGMRPNAWRQLTRWRAGALLYLSSFVLLCFSVFSPPISRAKDQPEATEPKLLSVFPLGGRQGASVPAEVRGKLLEGAYA